MGLPDLTRTKHINEDFNPVTDITEKDITALIHKEQDNKILSKEKQTSKSNCTLEIDSIADKLLAETRKNAALNEQIRILSGNQGTTQTPTPEGTQNAQLTAIMSKMSDLIHHTIKSTKQES